MPSAAKTYQAQYRKGGRTRRVSAGRHGKITVEEARKLAKEIMGQVAKGENPAEEISQHRKAPTVAAFCERFTAHTGDHGAVWLFQDPEDRIPNNPGITVDFRAFGLATGGLDHAEQHFRDCMGAFGIPYVETQLRVARADFAVDFLAPWFEPDREALALPPGTRITEYTGIADTATMASGARVVGLRAGAVANRQLAIYDKRAEVIQTNKMGWLTIWNAALEAVNKPVLDLSDRNTSQVWRIELRLGSKQLRNRFEMRNWQDLRDMIGDAFTDALTRLRYCIPTTDRNRGPLAHS